METQHRYEYIARYISGQNSFAVVNIVTMANMGRFMINRSYVPEKYRISLFRYGFTTAKKLDMVLVIKVDESR